MFSLIIILLIIVIVIFIFQRIWFSSSLTNTKSEKFSIPPTSPSTNPNSPTNQVRNQVRTLLHDQSTNQPKLYIYVSERCPACNSYKANVHSQVLSDAKALGIQVQLVYTDKQEDMENVEYKSVEQQCGGIEYIPTACMVSNGKVVKLGNGNGLNRDKLANAL